MNKFDSKELKRLKQILNEQERIDRQLFQQCKPNPNHYPIVDKWNYKYVYLPYRIELFESIVDYIYKKTMEGVNDEWFGKFCDVKQISY